MGWRSVFAGLVAGAFAAPAAERASRALFNKGSRDLFAALSMSEPYLASASTLAAENVPVPPDIRAGVLEDAPKYGMKIVVGEDGELLQNPNVGRLFLGG